MENRLKLYSGGQWVAPVVSECIEVVNPATEEVIGRIPAATAAEAATAVAAAREAFADWAATPPEKRADYLEKLQQGLAARCEEIARTITAEVGMPLKMSRRVQAGLPAAVMESYARLAREFPWEEQVGNSRVLRQPAGVVAAITPWNYPLHQIVCKVAPALAAGCTVVLKPSEVAPLNAFLFAEIVEEAGLPPGVFNLVSGYGPVAGEALASHPEVEMVSFTGSSRAGRRVAELAAATVKRVALELGGKSAALVLDDADLAAAVKGTVAACYLNSGQTCNAHTRLLVPEALHDQVAELAAVAAAGYSVGDPLTDTTRLGPLVSAAQRERVRGYIRKGVEEGACLLTGGVEAPAGLQRGYFVAPTVFGRVTPDMAIAREEIFGPVLCIMPYRDEEEAVAIANGTDYGLAGGVWSTDEERAVRVARRLRTGQVDINGGNFNVLAPFGGFRQSGNGRELGRYGLEEFLEYQSLQFKA